MSNINLINSHIPQYKTMFSTLLLDINKTLTNRILYKNKRPLQKAGVPRYCHYAKHSFRVF